MFSNFGNIFITKPRLAENADTRLGIRRHDPDQESRRKKNDSEEPAGIFDTEDNATVTVEALRIFLENFLKSLAPQTSEKNISAQAQNFTPEISSEPQRPIDGETAKAVGVYKHVAQKVEKRPESDSVSIPQNTASNETSLEAAEIRTIYKLLEDLKPLSARGIEYLTIERSENFLTSLVNAVRKAQS